MQVIHYFLELVKSTKLSPEQLVAGLHLLIMPLLERSFAMEQNVATNADVETAVKHLFDPPDDVAGDQMLPAAFIRALPG